MLLFVSEFCIVKKKWGDKTKIDKIPIKRPVIKNVYQIQTLFQMTAIRVTTFVGELFARGHRIENESIYHWKIAIQTNPDVQANNRKLTWTSSNTLKCNHTSLRMERDKEY